MNYLKFREKINELIDLLEEAERNPDWPQCIEENCTRPAVARGLCARCYVLWRRGECAAHNVKGLREINKLIPPDPRQGTLFKVFDVGGPPNAEEEPEVKFRC